MAESTPYKLSMTASDADFGIQTGMAAGKTSGLLYGDGQSGVRAATPGTDFGFPLLQGNGPPTPATAANLGQFYFDMAATKAPYIYVAVGYSATGFVWLVLGDSGTGFKILGVVASLEALEAAIASGQLPAPTAGAAYQVGTAAPYDVYIFDGISGSWLNNGPLGGAGVSGAVPPHGTAGQLLGKLSDADYDTGWVEPFTLPIATTAVLGGVKSGGDISVFSTGAMSIKNGIVTRAKLANDALYSPIKGLYSKDTNYSLSLDDLGCTIATLIGTVDYTITISDAVGAAFPKGGEVAVFWQQGTSVKIACDTNTKFAIAGQIYYIKATVALAERFAMVGLKKIATENGITYWAVTGPVEVVE